MSTDRPSGNKRKGTPKPSRKASPKSEGREKREGANYGKANRDDDRSKKRFTREDDKASNRREEPRGRGDKRYPRNEDKRDERSSRGYDRDDRRSRLDDTDRPERKPYRSRYVEEVEAPKPEEMPLNKFLAHCGICSRRDAAELVKEGKVKVNGNVELKPGYKVLPNDKVVYNDKILSSQKDLMYILLNKPKNYITTTDDPRGRRTVMDLIKGVKGARIYPVGRLDRNTTGLLLLTNDGDLAQRLSHPKYNIKKVYQVTLNQPLSEKHFEEILAGLQLEDGKVKVDALAYLEKKNEIGIEIHSGRNRIVRRIFEHLGYTVDKLDRVMYAGLTKKNIPRGKWRALLPKEVITLKHFKN